MDEKIALKFPSFKASVALSLLGRDMNTQQLQRLSGRTPASSKTRIQYTPADMLAVRAKMAGVDVDSVRAAMATNTTLPRIIVTRMTKGGIGKTSMTVNLAAALALMGFRCLLIDGDPQASATNMLGIPTEDPLPHIGELLIRNTDKPDDLENYIIKVIDGGFLDLIPSDVELDSTNALMLAAIGREQRADQFITRNQKFLSKNYDVVLIDTNPSTTPLSVAFTYLAHRSGKILTVIEPEGSSLRALDSLRHNLDEIQQLANSPINLALLINKAQLGRKQSEKNMALLSTSYGPQVLSTFVGQSISFSRQVDADDIEKSNPLVLSEPTSKAAENIHQVAQLIVSEFDITQPGFPAKN